MTTPLAGFPNGYPGRAKGLKTPRPSEQYGWYGTPALRRAYSQREASNEQSRSFRDENDVLALVYSSAGHSEEISTAE